MEFQEPSLKEEHLWDDEDPEFTNTLMTPGTSMLEEGDLICGGSFKYSVLQFIGEGCYGKVAKCRVEGTAETVAVKIMKGDTDFEQDTEKEASMLDVISILDPAESNIVRFCECFLHQALTCLAFEMLDRSLYTLREERQWVPLSLDAIRPIAQQLCVALEALRGIGVLHADINPNNIMLVSHEDRPFKVKLIDFGGALPASKVEPGMELQAAGYRAPEVALGLPFTEAIDMWSVGSVMAFLFLAENLFPVQGEYQMMKAMVQVLGQPEDQVLDAGSYTKYFFQQNQDSMCRRWRMMTPEEFEAANGYKAEERNGFIELPNSLDELMKIHPQTTSVQTEDTRHFVDLLKRMLHLDGEQRISPAEALRQPFITMDHLTDDISCYVKTCHEKMGICTKSSHQILISPGPGSNGSQTLTDSQSASTWNGPTGSGSEERRPATTLCSRIQEVLQRTCGFFRDTKRTFSCWLTDSCLGGGC